MSRWVNGGNDASTGQRRLPLPARPLFSSRRKGEQEIRISGGPPPPHLPISGQREQRGAYWVEFLTNPYWKASDLFCVKKKKKDQKAAAADMGSCSFPMARVRQLMRAEDATIHAANEASLRPSYLDSSTTS